MDEDILEYPETLSTIAYDKVGFSYYSDFFNVLMMLVGMMQPPLAEISVRPIEVHQSLPQNFSQKNNRLVENQLIGNQSNSNASILLPAPTSVETFSMLFSSSLKITEPEILVSTESLAQQLKPLPSEDVSTIQSWEQCNPSEMRLYQAIRIGGRYDLSESDKLAESDKKIVGEVLQEIQKKQQNQKANRYNSELGYLERTQLLKIKLAEIVARQKPDREAKLKEDLIASAIDYAKQQRFEEARQIIQDPVVPTENQKNIFREISSLEAKAAKLLAAKEAEKVRLANQQRRQAQVNWINLAAQNVSPTALPSLSLGLYGANHYGFGLPGSALTGSNYYDSLLRSLRSQLSNNHLRFLFPLPILAPITSGYGWRTHPILGTQRFHSGVDIGAPEGTPVLAAYTGRVAAADQMGGYGLAVVLEHSNGSQNTLYAHLSQVLVRPGDQVTQGTVIGRVGSSGLSTGPHLHFELRQLTTGGWVTQDPQAQLETSLAGLMQALQSSSMTSTSPDRL